MGSVEIVFDGNGQRLMQLLSRMDRKYAETIGNMEHKTKKAFGDDGLSKIKDWVTGFGAVTAAIATATRAVEIFDQRSREAADRITSSTSAAGALVQVATSKADMRYLEGKSAEFSVEAGVPLNEAMRSVFSMRSAGVDLSDVKTFAQGQTIGLDAASGAKAAATLMATFGQGETGGFRNIFSKGFAASGGSPEAVGPLLEGTAGVGSMASQLGISDEEAMAAMQVLATSTGSASEGKTQLRGVLKAMVREQDRFKGRGLMGGLQLIARGGLGSTAGDTSGQALVKGFGDQEGFLGYASLMGGIPKFNQALSDINAAQENDLFGEKISIRDSSRLVRAGLVLRQETERLNQARQETGLRRIEGTASFMNRQTGRELGGGVSGAIESYQSDMFLPEVAKAAGVDRALNYSNTTVLGAIPLLGSLLNSVRQIADNTRGPVGGERPGADQ